MLVKALIPLHQSRARRLHSVNMTGKLHNTLHVRFLQACTKCAYASRHRAANSAHPSSIVLVPTVELPDYVNSLANSSLSCRPYHSHGTTVPGIKCLQHIIVGACNIPHTYNYPTLKQTHQATLISNIGMWYKCAQYQSCVLYTSDAADE